MSRILDFSDGFTSASEPSLINIEANNLKSYALDADFVTGKGSAAAAGDLYFNSTSGCVRHFNGAEWLNLVNGTSYNLTADTVPYINADEQMESSVVTSIELSYMSGVTSAIQTQLNDKASTTSLTNHLNDTTDAHAASAITNTPSGNLSATTAQDALNELQSDIDTRATSSNPTLTGSINASAATTLNAATSNTASTINIGTGSGANTITIGAANSTVNILGTVLHETATNVDISDALLTLNKGGGAGSASSTGLEFEENGTITGYAKTSGDRNSIEFKAPNTAGVASLTPGTTADTVTLNNASQTLNNKTLATPTITGTLTVPNLIDSGLTASTVPYADASKQLTSSTVTPTELEYLSGTTSAIQTQLNAKAPSASPTLTTPSTDIITLDGQASTPANPSAGFYKAYVKDSTQKLTILDSSGVETTVGTGSGSGINYITATDGSAIGSWVTYADAAASSPVDGTGGSANVTYAVSTNSDMRGTSNFLFTHDAVNRQGQGFSYDFTIDPSDKGKVLQISMEYLIASGTYADDDLQFWIYDVTNATLIQPAPFKLKNSGIIEKFAMEFQTSSSSTSYRLIGHVATSTATAYTIRFDNWNLGPQAKLYGSPSTDPVSATYTLTNAGNATATLGTVARDGSYLVGRVLITIGSSLPTGQITLNLPSGYTSSTTGNIESSIVTQTATQYTGVAYQLTGTTIIFQGGTGNWDATHPLTWSNGNTFWVNFRTPIQGWQSSTIMSSDAATNVVSGLYRGTPSGTLTSSYNTVKLSTKVKEQGVSYDTSTGILTILTPGTYDLSTQLQVNATFTAGNLAVIRFNINNGATFYSKTVRSAASMVTEVLSIDVKSVPLNAGDTVRVDVYAGDVVYTWDTSDGYNLFSIVRNAGPAQITASDSVSILYRDSAGTSITNGNTAAYATKVKDSHGAWSGTIFTAPMSGVYSYKFKIRASSGTLGTADNIGLLVMKNGSTQIDSGVTQGSGASMAAVVEVSGEYPLLAGETLKANYSTGVGGFTTINDSLVSINRIGNY